MEDRISRWTFRDIFLSLTLALDPVLLGVGYVGLLTAGGAYGFFYFLGVKTGDPGAAWTFSILGGILFVGVWIVTSAILARAVVIRLLEGRAPAAREVWDYLRARWRVLLMIPASFAAIVLGALGTMGVLELFGRLPGLGPILFGASFTLVFLLSLTAVLAFALHTFAGLLYPTILAVRSEGLLAIVGEILALARQKGALLLVYSLVILLAGAAASLLLLSLVWLALAVVSTSATSIMGADFQSVLAGLPAWFQPFFALFEAGMGTAPVAQDVAWHYDLGGLLLGVSLLSIFAATAAYPFVMVNSAGTVMYFILTDEELPSRLPLPGATPEEPDPAPPDEPTAGDAEIL